MSISKRSLKQQAYKRISRKTNKYKDIETLTNYDGQNVHMVVGIVPLGVGVWKYGKYLQPATHTGQYIKESNLLVGLMPKASPIEQGNAGKAQLSEHAITFTGIMEPATSEESRRHAKEIFARVLERMNNPSAKTDLFIHPHQVNIPCNPDGSLDIYALANRHRPVVSGKSDVTGFMVRGLKERYPNVQINLDGPALDLEAPFDLERMKKALASEQFQAPVGLSREEVRALILSKADGDDQMKGDIQLPLYNNVIPAPPRKYMLGTTPIDQLGGAHDLDKPAEKKDDDQTDQTPAV